MRNARAPNDSRCRPPTLEEGTSVETFDQSDLLCLVGVAMLVLDDIRRTAACLEWRLLGTPITPQARAELDRLAANDEHLARLLAALRESLRAERAGERLHELPDLILVEPDDPPPLVERLLMLAKNPEDLGHDALDVA